MRDIRVYKQGIVDRVWVTMRDLKSRKVAPNIVAPMVTAIQSAMTDGSRFVMFIPAQAKNLPDLQQRGYSRVRVDGEMYDIADVPKLPPNHTVDVVIDRIVMRDGIEQRIEEDLTDGLNVTGEVYVEAVGTSERLPFRLNDHIPPPPPEAMQRLTGLIRDHIASRAKGSRPSTMRSWGAVKYNPDYNIGYQHGAEIKLRDGIGRRWQR